MSATLTLDDELASRLEAAALKRGESANQLATQLLRSALEATNQPIRAKSKTFKVRPHAGQFAPGIQVDKLMRVADELELLEFHQRQTPHS